MIVCSLSDVFTEQVLFYGVRVKFKKNTLLRNASKTCPADG